MSQPLNIYNSALGLGDAISMLYAAEGAVRTGHEIRMNTALGQWLKPYSGQVEIVKPHERFMCGADVNGGRQGYANQIRDQLSRKRCYCDNIAAAHGIPRFEPALPASVVRNDGTFELDRNRVLVFPYSAYKPREYPQDKWARLVELLAASGYDVRVLAAELEGTDPYRLSGMTRLEKTFKGWRQEDRPKIMIGLSPEQITQLMITSGAVIANDSGMAHLAGWIGVPALVMQSHLRPEVVWGLTEVRVITPDTGCVFCGWQEDNGYSKNTCARRCSALDSIHPEVLVRELGVLMGEVRHGSEFSKLDIAA